MNETSRGLVRIALSALLLLVSLLVSSTAPIAIAQDSASNSRPTCAPNLPGSDTLVGSARLPACAVQSDPTGTLSEGSEHIDARTHRLRYGANVQLLAQPHAAILSAVQGMGFGWLRQEVRWRDIEPRPSEYDWHTLDALVSDAASRGLKVLLQVSAPRADALHEPEDVARSYADLMSAVAARYRGQVQAYEISDASVPATAYVRLLKAAYSAVKAADPQATVVTVALASLDGQTPEDYLRQMYEAGARAFFDAVGAQFWSSAQDGFVGLEALHSVMERNGDGGKEIWVVKFGWPVSLASGAEQEQAIRLASAYVLGLAQPYVGLMAFWNLSVAGDSTISDAHEAYSIIARDGTARPAMELLASMPKT